MQHKSAYDQQPTFSIMMTTVATARNIRLIIETIIMSHTGIAHHTATPWFQSVDQCWVCVCTALSLSVLYTVQCQEDFGITFQIELFMDQS